MEPEGLFLTAPPGLEPFLAEEAVAAGFGDVVAQPGGVSLAGGWATAWRANLQLRGATRVLARLTSFYAVHLAQLDKRARRLPWAALLGGRAPVAVDASCRKSRIYHEGAAAERLRAALEASGLRTGPGGLRLMLRIEADLCTISLDTSGEPLHRRGFKQAVGRAPMRETMAALFLRACGYCGREALLDPMCGSGSFPIEAAEIGAGLMPGRARQFAFEQLPGFDPEAFATLRQTDSPGNAPLCFGSDRDAGAVVMAQANAARAGVAALTRFSHRAVSDIARPDSAGAPDAEPGLVMVNPPYGGRIGKTGALTALYAALGKTLKARFVGWRVGLITAQAPLAQASGLPFGPPGPAVPHGPLKVRLYQAQL
ncbi:MAG: class I SAM-dependent RNA methyltransferase [Pseudomonadota bacterium]